MKCLCISFANFLIGLFFFEILNFESSLYILDTNPNLDMSFAEYVPPHLYVSFCHLRKVFHRAKYLNFDDVQLIKGESILYHDHITVNILFVLEFLHVGNWVRGTRNLSVFLITYMEIYSYLNMKSLKKTYVQISIPY